MKNNRRTLLEAICFLMLILSAGCAALSPVAVKQETLEERVKNYMQAQADGKWDRAWSFFDASSREKTTQERYVNRPKKYSFREYGIKEITVLPSGEQATVIVTYDISLMGYAFKGVPQTQAWVKENGAWFVKYDPSSARQTFFMPQKKQQ